MGTPTTSTTSQAMSPTCFQLRALNDPPSSQLSSALTDASAVPYVCSNTTAQRSNNNSLYSNVGALLLNITRRSSDRNSGLDQVLPSYCSQNFQNIINICLLQQSFWGGWILIERANWSVSNKNYPRNLLPLLRAIDASSTSGQLSKTQTGAASFTKNTSTPASTISSEDPSDLLLARDNLVSNAKVSLSGVAAATLKTSSSVRGICARQSQIQLSTSADPSVSATSTSIVTPAVTSQGNSSNPLASAAPKKLQSKISSPMTSVSLFTHATQISGSRIPTITSLLGSLAGGNESAKIPEISGPVTIAPDYTITDAFRANLSTTTVSASHGAVLVCSMRTFSDLANRTGTPFLIQTTVPKTLSNGNRVTYRGGIWITSGGRYWFPPWYSQFSKAAEV